MKENPNNQKTRRARKVQEFAALGVAAADFRKLCRLERLLHKWGEDVCNGVVSVGEGGEAYRHFGATNYSASGDFPINNDETFVLLKVKALLQKYPALWFYHQGDPRGCALYVGKREGCDVPSLESHYSTSGHAVYLPD